MTVMAILQEVDKCIRCNGCVIACKREWKMRQETIGVMKVDYDQRLAIKSQKRVDMGPFVRFTCWHCPDPPCAKRCPTKAITKKPNGAVNIDYGLCNIAICDPFNTGRYPCQIDCQRGGYPKIGKGSDLYAAADKKANKCTLCSGRAGEDSEVGPDALPTTATAAEYAAVPGKKHMPACVFTCPAKAMKWDTQANILAYLRDPANGYVATVGGPWLGSVVGAGSLYWASKKVVLAPPKADPFVEDHLAPAASGLLSSPIAKAAIIPTILVGGLMALSARRAANEEALAKEEEVS